MDLHPNLVLSRTQPITREWITDKEVEWPVRFWVQFCQRLSGLIRRGVIQGFQHQFAATALKRVWPQATFPIGHHRHHALVIDTQPTAPAQPIQSTHQIGTVPPMPTRRTP